MSDLEAYCLKCKKTRGVKGPYVANNGSSERLAGQCDKCGTKVSKTIAKGKYSNLKRVKVEKKSRSKKGKSRSRSKKANKSGRSRSRGSK